MRGAGDKMPLFVEDLPVHESAPARGNRAFDRMQKPIVETKRRIKPYRVIKARDLHAWGEPRHPVRQERCCKERIVRSVSEKILMIFQYCFNNFFCGCSLNAY